MKRPQFSLRTLLIVVTLLAIPCGYVGWQAKIVRDRKELMQLFRDQGCKVVVARGDEILSIECPKFIQWAVGIDDTKLPWYRHLLDDHYVVDISYSSKASTGIIDRVKTAFPEALLEVMESEPPPEK